MDLRTALSKNGVLHALQKAKRDGLCRFIGISGHHRPAKFVRALQDFDIDVMMCAVNFADRHTYNFERTVFPIAARKNVGLVAMKVYGGADWRSQARSNRMMPEEYLRQAFRYALSLPNVALNVVGMASREELAENLRWAKSFKPLTAGERSALEEPGRRLAARWGAHFGPVA